jgi:ppGpp synthetase/RelA/SpoT-type nucleotidyltranferase
MSERNVEDRLREEYFLPAPDIRRVLHQLQTDTSYLLLQISLDLKHHERIQIEARAKECESAIGALRRREEARQFDEDTPERYSLTNLPDLAALRVLVFPKPRLQEVHAIVSAKYADWTSDPVTTGRPPKFRAWKCHGYCSASSRIRAEIQIVPMLTGLFWQVEHDAFYKPRDAILQGAVSKPIIREHTEAVYDAFEALEAVLEQELQKNAEQDAG